MPRYRCRKHGRPPKYFEFENEHGEGTCPLCGTKAKNVVRELIPIHYVVLGSGPIYGQYGHQHVACQPKRDGLALHRMDNFAATDDPRQVTCPSCRGTKAWQECAAHWAVKDKKWRAKLMQQAMAKMNA